MIGPVPPDRGGHRGNDIDVRTVADISFPAVPHRRCPARCDLGEEVDKWTDQRRGPANAGDHDTQEQENRTHPKNQQLYAIHQPLHRQKPCRELPRTNDPGAWPGYTQVGSDRHPGAATQRGQRQRVYDSGFFRPPF